MPACCGSGASCSCKIVPGDGITLGGSGTATDPFVIGAAVAFSVQDNARFDLSISGVGSSVDPYTLSVDYAATSKLDDVPDVNATSPANGQVLAWNTATSKWVPQNPTTAAAGSVLHDQSLTGDGSAGQPLGVNPYAARYLALFGASGIGINDAGINQMVRHFVDSTARDSASPVPILNTLTMLDSDPGRIQFWDGVQWSPLLASFDSSIAAEFLALSGAYLGSRTTHLVKQFAGNTDATGLMDILTPADLVGRGGVLSVCFQETGSVAFKAVLFANTDRVSATVYHLSDGSLYPSFAFTGIVDAWLY